MIFNKSLNVGVTEADANLQIAVMRAIDSVTKYIERTKIDPAKIDIDCHTITRAIVSVVPDLRVADGYYLGIHAVARHEDDILEECSPRRCLHSWLVTPNGAIVEAYPVGVIALTPLLLGPSDYGVFGYDLYHECPIRARAAMPESTDERAKQLSTLFKAARDGTNK